MSAKLVPFSSKEEVLLTTISSTENLITLMNYAYHGSKVVKQAVDERIKELFDKLYLM